MMDITITPITERQRSTMPRFNNVEKHGLNGGLSDSNTNYTLAEILEAAKNGYDANSSLQENIDRTMQQLDADGSNTPAPQVQQNAQQKEQLMLWGSVGVLIVAAILAKKLL